MSNEVALISTAKRMNESVSKVIGADKMMGFEKSYLIAIAIQELKEMLTPEYMKPIMALQGNKMGFKADKVYPEGVVKDCLIEAVLMGVQPFGNQFNIIAGNSYITKEGFGFLLSNFAGLSYDIIPQLPRIKDQSAAIVMDIEWTLDGISKKKSIDFAIKVNNYMGADAVIGKATRKARAWLYNSITGSEIADGDVSDANVVSTKINGDHFVTIEDLQFLFDTKKETMSTEDLVNANRIIGSREEKSYSKLYKHLQTL